MKTYEVIFKIDGKSGSSITINAPNSMVARRMAMGQLQGMAGYVGKRISISVVRELR